MLSQLTRQRILENARKVAEENAQKIKVQEVKAETSEEKIEEKPAEEPKPQYNFQKKKTDAEKLKKKD